MRRRLMDNARKKLAECWAKLKKIKNIEFILCVFILAAVLLVYAGVKSAAEKKSVSDGSVSVTADVSSSSTMNDEEKRVAAMLSGISGVGQASVYINRDADGVCRSVLVVAEGADSVEVRLKILEAVETALLVKANAVEIYSM